MSQKMRGDKKEWEESAFSKQELGLVPYSGLVVADYSQAISLNRLLLYQIFSQ